MSTLCLTINRLHSQFCICYDTDSYKVAVVFLFLDLYSGHSRTHLLLTRLPSFQVSLSLCLRLSPPPPPLLILRWPHWQPLKDDSNSLALSFLAASALLIPLPVLWSSGEIRFLLGQLSQRRRADEANNTVNTMYQNQ